MNKQFKDFLRLSLIFITINGAYTLKTYAQEKGKMPSKTQALAPLDSKGGGGGSAEEANLVTQQISVEENLLKVKKFFLNHTELAKEFPEVNIDTLIQKIEETKVVILDKKLIDKHGAVRTALNFPTQNLIQYNATKLKNLTKDPELFFVMNFHELLGLIGVEESNPANESLVASYPISSRIAKYVKKVNNYDLVFKVENRKSSCTLLDKGLTNIEKERLYQNGIALVENTYDENTYYISSSIEIFYLNGDNQFLGRNSLARYVPARKKITVTLYKVKKGKYVDSKEIIKSLKGSRIGIEGRSQGTKPINIEKKEAKYRKRIIDQLINICTK